VCFQCSNCECMQLASRLVCCNAGCAKDRQTTPNELSGRVYEIREVSLFDCYANNLNQLRVVAANSTPNPNHTTGGGQPALIQGADCSPRGSSGYNNVTGLGTPNVPAMIEAFATF
jgi:hypothetical protein